MTTITVRHGSTRLNVFIFAHDDKGTGVAGLGADTPGSGAAYVRDGENRVWPIALRASTLGEHNEGGFTEVDQQLLPGLYQLGIPDQVLGPGAVGATFVVRFPGVLIEPVSVRLVAFDAQDEVRLGMGAIGPEARIAALRGAFPRLAARELDEAAAREEPR